MSLGWARGKIGYIAELLQVLEKNNYSNALKKLISFFACAVALLHPGAEAELSVPTLPPEQPTGWGDEPEFFRFEVLPPEYTEELREACRECRAIKFFADICSPTAKTLTLKPGKVLDSLREQLIAVPQWYECLCDDINFEMAEIPAIYMLDEEGIPIWIAEISPGGPCYTKVGEEYISLWEFCRRHLASVAPADVAGEKDAPPEPAFLPSHPTTPGDQVLSAKVSRLNSMRSQLNPFFKELDAAACFEGIHLRELRSNTEEGVFGMPTELLLFTEGAPVNAGRVLCPAHG